MMQTFFLTREDFSNGHKVYAFAFIRGMHPIWIHSIKQIYELEWNLLITYKKRRLYWSTRNMKTLLKLASCVTWCGILRVFPIDQLSRRIVRHPAFSWATWMSRQKSEAIGWLSTYHHLTSEIIRLLWKQVAFKLFSSTFIELCVSFFTSCI